MNDIGTKKLETERLILRKIKLEDAHSMYKNWASDPKTNDFMMWDLHQSEEETKEVIQSWLKEYEDNAYRWIVVLKDSMEPIGTIDLVHYSKKQKRAEVGYCYGSKYWNHGYATEALSAVIHFLLETVGFELVEAVHLVTNPASGRVMEKAGMKKEATLRKRYIDPKTKLRTDVCVYSIMKEDYYVF